MITTISTILFDVAIIALGVAVFFINRTITRMLETIRHLHMRLDRLEHRRTVS